MVNYVSNLRNIYILSGSLHCLEENSYIALLEDWEIAPSKLKLLDKKLGGGKFGIVRKGLLTIETGSPEAVAVKTLKGAKKLIYSSFLMFFKIMLADNLTKVDIGYRITHKVSFEFYT